MVEQNDRKGSRWKRGLSTLADRLRTTQSVAVPPENQVAPESTAELNPTTVATEEAEPVFEVVFTDKGPILIDLPTIVIENIEAAARPFSDTCNYCGGEVDHGKFPYKTTIAADSARRVVLVKQLPADKCKECKRFVHIDPPVIVELTSKIAAKLKEEAQQGKNSSDSSIS